MGPRLRQQLLHLCYAAVVWCTTMAPACAAPRLSPAEQQSNEDYYYGDVGNITYTPDGDNYYYNEYASTYNEKDDADVDPDYYALTADELTTKSPSPISRWPLMEDGSSSYNKDYDDEDGINSDEAAAAEDDDTIEIDDELEGLRSNGCDDSTVVDGASDEDCMDVDMEPENTEGVEQSSEDTPYSY